MKRIGILLVAFFCFGMLSFTSCKQDNGGTESTEEVAPAEEEMAPAEEEMAPEEDMEESDEEDTGEY
ncbi:MAG: hypothetical protein ACOCWA_10350 [Bacteroidota bacterium]